ncbi:unnamed protein product [Prunus brigantina]
MWKLKFGAEGEMLTLTCSAQTSLWEGRYGSLILMQAHLKSEPRLKRLVKTFTTIVTRSSPAVTSSGKCSFKEREISSKQFPKLKSKMMMRNVDMKKPPLHSKGLLPIGLPCNHHTAIGPLNILVLCFILLPLSWLSIS